MIRDTIAWAVSKNSSLCDLCVLFTAEAQRTQRSRREKIRRNRALRLYSLRINNQRDIVIWSVEMVSFW